MSEAISERQRLAIEHLFGVAKVAVLNLSILAALALLTPAFGATFSSRLLPNGTIPELAAYCARNLCSVSPSSVGAVYLLQAIYGGGFIIGAWVRLKEKRRASFVAIVGVIILALQTISQPFGFERTRSFANYVYDSPVYLMFPAVLILVFCTAMHVFLRNEKFERESARWDKPALEDVH